MRNADGLSLREVEILKYVASGLTYKEIAWELKISKKTVDAHVVNLKRILGINSIARLTHFAMARKIVKLESFKHRE